MQDQPGEAGPCLAASRKNDHVCNMTLPMHDVINTVLGAEARACRMGRAMSRNCSGRIL